MENEHEWVNTCPFVERMSPDLVRFNDVDMIETGAESQTRQDLQECPQAQDQALPELPPVQTRPGPVIEVKEEHAWARARERPQDQAAAEDAQPILTQGTLKRSLVHMAENTTKNLNFGLHPQLISATMTTRPAIMNPYPVGPDEAGPAGENHRQIQMAHSWDPRTMEHQEVEDHQEMEDLQAYQEMEDLKDHQEMEDLQAHQEVEDLKAPQEVEALQDHQAVEDCQEEAAD